MAPFLPTLRGVSRRSTEVKVGVPVAMAQYYASIAGLNHTSARDWPVERAVAEGYDRVMWVFKSVNTIAADSARLPFRLRDGDDEDSPVVEDHPLYRVLNKQANPLERGPIFRKRLSAQILLSKKGAFVEITKSNGGSIIRVDLLPPDRVTIIPDSDGGVSHYELARRNGGVKNLDPDKVRWFRDPHPIDPYMGVTPLESAGMSIELDHFARMYNVAFLRNDGRPGGILAVRDTKGGSSDIDPAQMDRIESRFGKGPVEAGKLSVVAGALDYVDLAAKPRDMQYGALSSNSRMEILGAFGIGESVFGNASGRTFDNADNELYVYWTRTLPPHHEIILTGFDEDSEDTFNGFLDTSKVEILERVAKDRRSEARDEVNAGLRSLYNYAQLAKIDDIESTPHTRALYIPTGKTPLPSTSADAEALGMGAPVADPNAGPDALPTGGEPISATDEGEEAALPPGSDPAALPGPAPAAALNAAPTSPASSETPSGAARAALRAVAGKGALHAIEGGRPKAVAAYRLSRKAADEPSLYIESVPDEEAAVALERTVAKLLAGLSERWTERAAARLASPKQRKGTRHWTPEYPTDTRVGTKALDTAKSVDEDTWQSEAEQAIQPVVLAAAIAAATALMAEMGVTPPPGYTLARMAADAVAQSVAGVVTFVGRAAANQAMRLSSEINRLDQSDADLDDIVAAVRDRAARLLPWCDALATQVATATVNGARDDGAREANRDEALTIERAWLSRRDDNVRASHRLADGQVRGLDEPFIVGSSLLMRPGDPTAPVHETANCRCRLKHRSKRTGRFVAGGVKALPRDADGDGMVYDGTPMQRPAPVRVAVPTAAVMRPTADATASPAKASVATALVAKGAARVAKYRAKARDWDGPRLTDELAAFKPWSEFRATAAARRGVQPAAAPLSEDQSRELLTAMYSNTWTTSTGRSVKSAPSNVEVFEDRARITGEITDEATGKVIGTFKRVVTVGDLDGARVRHVVHDELMIEPDSQGEGIGAEFNAHSMAFYREHGIESIKIKAGGSIDQSATDAMNGGYVWSTQGFDFDRVNPDPPFSLSPLGSAISNAQDDSTRDQLLNRLAFLRIPSDWLGESDNLASILVALRQIDPADPPSPYEIAMIGADRVYPDPDTGMPTWFGKAAMSRTSWAGSFDMSWFDDFAETKAFTTAADRPRLMASQMCAALGDDTDTASEVLVSGLPEENEDAEREVKAARMPRDGDSDGFIHDGTVRQMPAPLRSIRGNEQSIARGAGKIAPHARQAADWQGARFTDMADGSWRDAERALVTTFGADFTTSTGRVVRTEVSADAYVDSPAYEVHGRFIDVETGDTIGTFERMVDVSGPVVVHHTGLSIEPWAQGEGIATEFNAHAFAWYRHMGVDEAVVSASGTMRQASKKPQSSGWTMTVADDDPTLPVSLAVALNRPAAGMNGGYTWGQSGFDWKNATFLNTIPGTMLMAVEAEPDILGMLRGWDDIPVADRSFIEGWFELPFLPSQWWADAANRAMLLRFLDETDYNRPPTPYEINRMGETRPYEDPETGEETWFGKAIMSRSSWLGYFDPKWLDAYVQTKSRASKSRRQILAAAFLTSLGADASESSFEEKSIRSLGSTVLDMLMDEGEIELGLPRRALRRGSHPRDGDGDGFVYDGTPRQRPVAPRTYTTPAARGGAGGMDRAVSGRPYAETLERQRTRRAEAEQAAVRRAAARNAVSAATRTVPEPTQAYLVAPGDAPPWDGNAGPTEGMSLILTRLAEGPVAAGGGDVSVLDRIVRAARAYDGSRRDGDTDAARDARDRLLTLLAQLRDMRKPNGDPMVAEEDLGVSFAEVMSGITRNRTTKSVYTGDMSAKATPRDADGDGFIYDGTPRQRPATPRLVTTTGRTAAAVWRRHANGYLTRDGEWFLERQGRMSTGGTNGWVIMRRVPADRIGQDDGGAFDTRDGGALAEVDGTLYSHEGDAGSLAEAKATVASLEVVNVEADPETYQQAGYDAAAEKFGALTPDQMRVAREQTVTAAGDPGRSEQQREALTGAVRWLTEAITAAEAGPREDTPATGAKDDPIDVRGDLDLAARLISEGKHVRLNRVDEIGTFVTRLAALVRMAEERGETAPTYDLCKVSVPGTNLFCEQSKGIPRLRMPQLSGKPKPGSPADALPRNERGNVNIKPLFRDWLISRGVAVEEREVDAAWLKASQHELDGPAVGRIYAAVLGGGKVGSGSWATRDGYILDGHHQWAAQVAVDSANGTLGDHQMPVQIIDMEIGEAFTLAHEFSAEQGIIPAGIGAADTARATPDIRAESDAVRTTRSDNGTVLAAIQEPEPGTPAAAYAELRRTGGLVLTPEERTVLTALRRLARADGLQVVAGYAEGQRGLTRDQQRRRPTYVNLVRPENPTTIYAPDA